MGWCSATAIIDTAIEAAERAIAHAWQIASGNENAKTPAYANELRTRPRLRSDLDDTLRPFVAAIAGQLRHNDWDCIEESQYFARFRQEMLGYDDHEMAGWYRDMLAGEANPDRVREYSRELAALLEKITQKGK